MTLILRLLMWPLTRKSYVSTMKMQKTFNIAGWLLSALMATSFPSSADAGLKYWTTGNYDADSYVQDGLVLNYDGIRNVGIDQPALSKMPS